jgi:hypothetical protein
MKSVFGLTPESTDAEIEAAIIDEESPMTAEARKEMVDEHRAFLRGPERKSSAPAAAKRGGFFTDDQLEIIGRCIGELVRDEIEPLRERIERIERKPSVEYKGVWKAGGPSHTEGSLTTHQGGLWIALRRTQAKPGNGNAAWRLIVKSGGA